MPGLNYLLTLHQGLFYLHLIAGCMALLLFWVPIFSKKGSLNHRRFGYYYSCCMYMVVVPMMLSSMMVLIAPVFFKGQHLAATELHADFMLRVRLFYGFLFYLGWLVYCGLQASSLMLKHKQNRQALCTPGYLGSQLLLGVGGVVLLLVGLYFQQVLHMVFGVVGLLSAVQALRYPLRKQVKAKQWLIEHFGAMIGTGIAAYTAVLTFGGRRLLNLGDWNIALWFLPGVVGAIGITWLTKQYGKEPATHNAKALPAKPAVQPASSD